jgi:hypothetical protein
MIPHGQTQAWWIGKTQKSRGCCVKTATKAGNKQTWSTENRIADAEIDRGGLEDVCSHGEKT